MRSWRRLTLVITAVLAAAVVAGIPIYVKPQIDQLRRADAILVIGGAGFDRYPYGMTLAWQQWAPNLVLSTGEPGDAWLNNFCDEPPAQFKVYCFAPKPPTTRGEARRFSELAAAQNWHSVIVVTARSHISRARMIIQRCFPGEIIMVESPVPIPWQGWVTEYFYQTSGYIRAALQPGC